MTPTFIVAICAIVLLVLAFCILGSCSYKSVEDKKNAIRGLVSLTVGIFFATIAMCDLIFNGARRVKTKKHPVIYRENTITTKGEIVNIDTTYTYIFNRK